MERKEKKSKLSKLSYEKLELQKYLFDEKTTVAEKITAFKWRTRMAEGFGENYRGGRDTVVCPLCSSHPDSQEDAYKNCSYIENIIEVEEEYSNLFEENITKKFINTIAKISKIREK